MLQSGGNHRSWNVWPSRGSRLRHEYPTYQIGESCILFDMFRLPRSPPTRPSAWVTDDSWKRSAPLVSNFPRQVTPLRAPLKTVPTKLSFYRFWHSIAVSFARKVLLQWHYLLRNRIYTYLSPTTGNMRWNDVVIVPRISRGWNNYKIKVILAFRICAWFEKCLI